jgi:outer membrane lipoprotein SlyB
MSELHTVPTTASRLPRNALLVGGGLALAGFGLAAGLMLRAPAEKPATAPVTASATTDAPLTAQPNAVPAQSAAPAPAPAVAPHKPAPVAAHSAPRHETTTARAPSGDRVESSGVREAGRVTAQACASCGVIESVTPVQQKGEGTGVGAVAGGVVGGALGNQMGHGNGRAAMTILGAIGGGLAGNEIEKRTRSETVYQVAVRMDDGSLRTITQRTAPTAGQRVTVQGQTIKALGSGNAGSAEPRLVQTGQGV